LIGDESREVWAISSFDIKTISISNLTSWTNIEVFLIVAIFFLYLNERQLLVIWVYFE
jgi:hypothetical protein